MLLSKMEGNSDMTAKILRYYFTYRSYPMGRYFYFKIYVGLKIMFYISFYYINL